MSHAATTSALSGWLQSPVFVVMATVGVCAIAQGVYSKKRWFVLNPVLTSVFMLIGVVLAFNIPMASYTEGTRFLTFWLDPAVVALGVALYQQRLEIARQARAILPAIAVGCVVGLVSVTILIWLFGATREVVISSTPKSVSTPIAIGIAKELGGDPSLAAMMVIMTGISGAVFGPGFLRLIGVRHPAAFGLAIGAASHGIGTARAMDEGPLQGAAGGLAIGLHGLFAALFAPLWMRLWWPN